MNHRIYNFGAGPATLPEQILKEAQEELLNWNTTGMSILEIGHRTPEFLDLINHAEQTLRDLLNIPPAYHILFLGGAARTQFACIPMNFSNSDEKAAYLVTGIWSQMAEIEAKRLKKTYIAASAESNGFTSIPTANSWTLEADTSYLYYCPNETVNGLRFPYVPKVANVPLIADMTSCLLSEPIDIEQYDLIFAGAQKNIANAGLTLLIIKDQLLNKVKEQNIPIMLDYKVQAEHHSIYATPPVFNIYLADKMFDWIKAQGGVQSVYQHNCAKAEKLYQYIDSNEFYSSNVAKQDRSLVNVCFSLRDPQLEAQFIEEAEASGLSALKGHRFVGGLRASLYNAMPMAGVDALIDFMSAFSKEHSK